MRFLVAAVLLALVSGPDAAPPERQGAAADPDVQKRLGDFLTWAHPAENGCGTPEAPQILEAWDGGLRAAYRIACGASLRRLQGVFEVRQQVKDKEGVWQVAQGFEAEAVRVDSALGVARAAPSPAGLAPPPGNAAPNNTAAAAPDTPLRFVAAPEPIVDPDPEYPEEAGRARLIGDARVELLVQIGPDGRPVRARPLRGPDPDLGMRRAAIAAVLRWRFEPARLEGRPVTYYRPVDLTFRGLPPESREWTHRALFHVYGFVSEDEMVAQEILERLRKGEPFGVAARNAGADGRGGDWGFVSAASLPAAVRRALHEAKIGEPAGPVTAEGLQYVLVKRGEVYYALRPRAEGELKYQILHQRNAPEGEALRQAVESDIAEYMAESRREAYMNEAARVMGIRQVQTGIGQLEIHTDVLDDDEVRTLGRVVEAAVRAHEAFWTPLVPLRPFNQQVQVYAWARLADHDRLHRFWQSGRAEPVVEAQPGASAGPARPRLWSFIGEYIPASRILSVPCDRMGGHLPVPIVVHEAIHMLDYERAYAAGVLPSQWFEEGLATYYGFSQIGSRLDIEPGDIQRSGTIVSGNVRVQFDPRTPLHEYMKRIADEGPVSLRSLLTSKAGDAMWSGDQTVLAYGASWTLVHFLLHGDRGTRRAAFGEYARAESQGRGGYDTFVRLLGNPASLEEAWHRYEENL